MIKMIKVDRSKCTKCRTCVKLCPFAILKTEDGYPILNPKKKCLECYHCVAACPCSAMTVDGASGQEAQTDYLNEAFAAQLTQLIKNRRSIRHYQDTPFPHYKLKELLETVKMAPTAKNQQAVKWVAVVGKDKTKKVMDLVLEWVEGTGNNPELKAWYEKGLNVVTLNAPALLFVYAEDDTISPEIDCTIALTTADLLLQSQGVGTCNAGYLRRISDSSEKLRNHLGIPGTCHIYGALTLGYPDKEEYIRIPERNELQINWV